MIINFITKIPREVLDFLHIITQNLYPNSVKIVGGFVRDGLLNILQNNCDIDLSTTANPREIRAKLSNIERIVIKDLGGEQYGTLCLIDKYTGKMFEITSTRRDILTFGRGATVEFCASFEEDSMRRDFTVNALYCDLDGNISDYHHGIDDLNSKNIRFIGDIHARITEDYLRILRYFRFCNIFQNISPDITKICQKYAPDMKIISKERIKNEMEKMLNYPSYNTLKTMQDAQILQYIIPGAQIDIIEKIEQLSVHFPISMPINEIKFASLFHQNFQDFCLNSKQKSLLQKAKLQLNYDVIDSFIHYGADLSAQMYMLNTPENVPFEILKILQDAQIPRLEIDYTNLPPNQIKSLIYKHKREICERIVNNFQNTCK